MADLHLVEWDERYSVGIAIIDEQHRGLIKLANELFNGCMQGEEAANAYFATAVKKAVEYVKDHFATEENLLKLAGYPDFAAHKKQHEDFVRKIVEDVKSFHEGRKFVPNNFARFLRDWTLEHIAFADRKYKDHMAACGFR